MKPRQSNRERLYALMGDLHGLITLDMAKAVGVPAVEVRKLTARGALERAGRGVYRIPFAPASDFEQVLIALAEVGAGSVLVGTSVLALFDIGLEMPTKLAIAPSGRVRKQLPAVVELSAIHPVAVETIEGVACESIFEILSRRAEYARADRVRDEIVRAEELGFISSPQAKSLMSKVESKLSFK
ncbi:MAG: type IV toxin-antitoxin system AbiEi family antitoxin domain-containing protein [Micrococcales bacterium]